MDDLAADLEAFAARYPMDEAAISYIQKSLPEVQREVMRDFKPKQEGEADYSALIISFCKRRRQSHQQQHFIAAPPAPQPQFRGRLDEVEASAEEVDDLAQQVQALRDRYPFDDAAYNYVVKSAPSVQREILAGFTPKKEGEDDYSALVISFAKKCRANAFAEGAEYSDRDEYESFRQRYPFDEDTHHYLSTSRPEVRKYVMQNFKPPREGEADYSALLITYCKRCRVTADDLGGKGKGRQAYSAPPAYSPPAPSYSKGGRGYAAPEYDRGFGRDYAIRDYGRDYGRDQGRDTYGRDFEKGRGRDERGYQGDSRNSWSNGYSSGGGKGKGGAYGGHRQDARGHQGEGALHDFRRRFPMDDRAFDFLRGLPFEARRQVLDGFAPPREDSDYSALVIGYGKRCLNQGRGLPMGGDVKRQRAY
eukprot:TRINITY_DN85553_c0_g1_i1.p1 TRINITY_DN85553_c0_g1~~TRINITY_DN85553_c0_g1_i1.p1  ORF type:complete len:420 (-),score=53.63 TRINITY_DN85553_c0_g1_i1:136-1395(-)